MAEGVGFEPTAQGFAPRTAFPVPHLRPLGHPSWIAPKELAEGRGFDPPRDLRGPYPISSRTPSTGLGHPSANRSRPLRFKELAQQRATLAGKDAAPLLDAVVEAPVGEQPVGRLDGARLRVGRA